MIRGPNSERLKATFLVTDKGQGLYFEGPPSQSSPTASIGVGSDGAPSVHLAQKRLRRASLVATEDSSVLVFHDRAGNIRMGLTYDPASLLLFLDEGRRILWQAKP